MRNVARHTPGFTLVELLVVITVVVTLLALLAPALDRAVYQAELAVCGTRLHGIAVGAQTYAADYKRWYPDRKAPSWPNELSSAVLGPNGQFNGTGGADDRPMFRPYISTNGLLHCPLAGRVDLEKQVTDEAGRIPFRFSSYYMWFGFVYTKAVTAAERTIRRVGDRLVYAGDSFNILAMDIDAIWEAQPRAEASHPDADGVMRSFLLDNEVWNDPVVAAGTTRAFYAISWWDSGNINVQRGAIDTHYAYQDGSVQRLDGVKFADYEAGMAMLPLHREDGQATRRIQVPTR